MWPAPNPLAGRSGQTLQVDGNASSSFLVSMTTLELLSGDAAPDNGQ
jgi:hypothetical protein